MKKILAAIGLVLFAASAQAETSLWRLEGGGAPFFIGGTIHVLRTTDYPLPPEFDAAYEAVEGLVFETDIGGMSRPEIQALFMEKGRYPAGKSIRDALSKKTAGRLEAYLSARGLPFETFETMRPWMLAMTLSLLELQRHGIQAENGVDLHFYQKAAKDKKVIGWLESPAEQIAFLMSLDREEGDAVIENTLEEAAGLKGMLEGLISAWRTGETARLEKALLEKMATNYPKLYQVMILERNRRWLAPLEAMIRAGKSRMVLVGGGHLPGEAGLIQLLRQRGYRFKKFSVPKEK